ncbi:O-methyltransferase [Quillaja saponaria]|uniref:O-methyltransferase n=1 Tax=Quillaja saponaria TaxID=32244 RepID=A0AAD7VMR7_QUISA|nr:O-methyltransferase [Quillaja saponaria]
MELLNGEHAAELLQAQAHVWNHIFSFINSMSLKCAIELGIPDTIHNHGQPMTLSQLIAALPIHQSKHLCVYRLMRILIHSGFFGQEKVSENDQEEGYVLTDASRLLLKDHPLSVTPFLLAMLDPILIKPWHHMNSWFKNDDPTPFDTAHGMTLWDYCGHEPKLNHFFNDAMASGGTGTVAKAIGKAFPPLECTVFDLPHVVADLQDSENLKFVGGDMFEAIPPADAILLKWILHDWSDEECVKILMKCKEAIIRKGKEGKVIIIDMIMENKKGDDESVKTQLFFDMLMMALLTGRERKEKEWAKLIFSAGFSDYKITPILGLRSLIEVYP